VHVRLCVRVWCEDTTKRYDTPTRVIFDTDEVTDRRDVGRCKLCSSLGSNKGSDLPLLRFGNIAIVSIAGWLARETELWEKGGRRGGKESKVGRERNVMLK